MHYVLILRPQNRNASDAPGFSQISKLITSLKRLAKIGCSAPKGCYQGNTVFWGKIIFEWVGVSHDWTAGEHL